MAERKYKVVYLPVAVRDLDDIFDYICQDDPEAATGLMDRFDTSIGKLATFPGLGPVPNDQRSQQLGYRVLVIDDHLVFYVIVRDRIEVRRIMHGKQRYSFLL